MEKNLDVDRLRLIDVSSEDDCLISSSDSGLLGNQNDYFELTELDVPHETKREKENVVNSTSGEGNEAMVPSESSEPNMRKPGKCNLRKSLAWDSAFFTSAGVLEPDELSIINCGLKNNMPRIEEETRRSNESVSTFCSDSLDDLEVGLFEDIRASIQRSSQPSNTTYPSTPSGLGERGVPSSRKMDPASRSKMLTAAASRRQITLTPGLERTKKEPEKIKKDAEQTKKGTKMEATVRSRVTQAAARSGELTAASLRPPKIAGRTNQVPTSPTKKTCLGANRVKIEVNTVKSAVGRRETIGGLKRPVSGDRSATPRSTPSPKSSPSSSVSGTKVDSAASCSSHNRSGSTSSDSTDKSPFTSSRKKINCRNVNSSSASTLKSPLRIPSKNKTDAGDSRLSAYLMSIPKASPTISPASSLDDWSSESSSSASVNYHSNSSMRNLDISSPRKGFSIDQGASQSEARKHQGGQRYLEQKTTGLPTSFSKKTTSGAGSLTRPAVTGSLTRPSVTASLARPATAASLTRASATSSLTRLPGTEVPRSSKPSGLRMPSPKIGFFDAEKSTEPTQSVNLQFHPGVRNAIPKHGAGVGGAVKAKLGKVLPARSMAVRSSTSGDSHSTVSHCTSSTRTTSPAQPQELSNALPKISVTKGTRGNCPSVTPKSEKDEKPVTESHLMTGDLEDMNMKNERVLGSRLNEVQNDDLADDIVAIKEQVAETKTTRDCHDMPSKCQNNDSHRSGLESLSKSGEVEEKANTECEYSSSFVGEGGNCPSVTPKSEKDEKPVTESNLMTKDLEDRNMKNGRILGSHLNEGQNDGQNAIADYLVAIKEQVAETKTTRDCHDMPSTCQNKDSDRSGLESLSRSGEVEEKANTECEYSSSFVGEGGNCPSVTPMSEKDEKPVTESHLMTGDLEDMNMKNERILGSHLNEGQNDGQNAIVDDVVAITEQVTETTRDCHDMPSKCQNNDSDRTGVESPAKSGEVEEKANTKCECSSSFVGEGGNGGQTSFIKEMGSRSDDLSTAEAMLDNEGMMLERNDLHDVMSNKRHLMIEKLGELEKIEGESLHLQDGENLCHGALVNDLCNISVKSTMEISTNDVPHKERQQKGMGKNSGQLEDNLVTCNETHGSESHSTTGKVMSSEQHLQIGELGALEETENEGLHLNEGVNHGHDAAVNERNDFSKKIIIENSTIDVPHDEIAPIDMGQSLGHLESDLVSCQGNNESCGSENHSKISEVRELSKTECESFYIKEFDKYLHDAFVNDVGNLDEMSVVSFNDVPEVSCKPNFNSNCDKQMSSGTGEKLGHLDSNLISCHAGSEKENSLCSGNQVVDALIGPLRSMDLNIEELTENSASCLSQVDGKKDGSNNTELLPSSSSMDVLPKNTLCNETGSLESELTTEKGVHLIREGLQTEDK